MEGNIPGRLGRRSYRMIMLNDYFDELVSVWRFWAKIRLSRHTGVSIMTALANPEDHAPQPMRHLQSHNS